MIDEDLMRFADGEADAATSAAVTAAIAGDPIRVQRSGGYRAQRAAAATAFDDLLAEPVPDHLLALLRPAPAAVYLAVARAARTPRFAILQWAALAATLVAGFLAGHEFAPPAATLFTVDAALTHSLDGGVVPAIRIALSYRNRMNKFCRVFHDDRATPTAGIACQQNGGWRLLVAAAATGEVTDYRTAADDLPAAITATLDATISGAPLDVVGETSAAKRGWKN